MIVVVVIIMKIIIMIIVIIAMIIMLIINKRNNDNRIATTEPQVLYLSLCRPTTDLTNPSHETFISQFISVSFTFLCNNFKVTGLI